MGPIVRSGSGLGVLVLGAVVSLVGCRGDISTEPPIHLNPNMDFQLRYELQEASEFFADGRAMRPQPEGTVARGALKDDEYLHFGKIDGRFADSLPPSDDKGRPIVLDRALVERGQERFNIYCTPCHGPAGLGKGIVVARGMLPPPSFHDERLLAMPLGQLYDIVTHGARNMSGYQYQIPLRDRWAVAVYVRAIQVSRNARLSEIPAEEAAAQGWWAR